MSAYDTIISKAIINKGITGETVLCHVYKNGNHDGFVVCQEVTEETLLGNFCPKDSEVTKVTLPVYLVEVTAAFDNILAAYSFIKAGLVTDEQIENNTPPRGFGDEFNSYGGMAETLVTNGVDGFVYYPVPMDEYGYSNPSRRFILPQAYIDILGIKM